MLGSKKKERTAIDPDQKEMIENARLRIKQKRGLYLDKCSPSRLDSAPLNYT